MADIDARATQASFTAGELDPVLHGRKDLAKYQIGLKRLENCVVLPQGGVINRAGLRFVTEVKDSSKHTRLNTFEAAGDEAFLLEVGDNYIRPIYAGAYVDNMGSPYEIATTYTQAQIDELSLEQSNDVATLTHPEHPIRELARLATTNWQLSTVTFQPQIATPGGVSATGTNGYTGYGPEVVPKQYNYKVAAISATTGEESLPSAAAQNATPVALGYDPNYITVAWSAVAGASEYVIYKEENGIYGFVGQTPNLTFRDNNITADFGTGPQKGANPFNAANDYPSLATFAQGRRFFAATNQKPQTIWATQSGNYKNMGTSTPARADDALEFTLAARRKQDIFHIIPLEQGLIVFTRSSEWRVAGRDGDILQPDSILPQPQSEYGSSPNMRPIIVGEELLFCSRTERQVRTLEYSIAVDRYTSADLTLLAKHLFKTRSIVAWSHASEPDGLLWCVMSDGEVLCLTYLKEHEVWGWGRHHTAGRFLDVRVVPEFGRDVPYFLVERIVNGSVKKYIEFMEDRDFINVRDCFFVDSGLSYDNPQRITVLTTGTSTTLTVPAHGLANGDDVDLDLVGIVDSYGVASFPLDRRYYAASVTTNTFVIVDNNGDDIDTTALAGGYYDGGGVIRKPVVSVSGLGHLEGRAVACLADGNVVEGLVVTAGAVDMPVPASRIHVGLGYQSLLTTLDVQNTQGDDTGITRGRPKAYIRLDQTRGIRVGKTVDVAQEGFSRSYEDMYDPADLRTGLFDVSLWESWSEETQVTVVQDYPLPMGVLGITQDLVYGG